MNTIATSTVTARMQTLLQPPVVYQLHSRDYFARLSGQALSSLAWEHIESFLDEPAYRLAADGDARASSSICGGTEWQTRYEGVALSMGWDWKRSDDGLITACTTIPPRTNICVIDAGGYDMDPERTAWHLWNVIETLAWQTLVQQAVAAALPSTRRLS